jgi:outer membrane biosynthesis protein TonB
MRKTSIFVISVILAVSLTGCSKKADEPGDDGQIASPSSFSAGESTEAPDMSEGALQTEAPEETTNAALSGQQAETSADSGGNPQKQPSDSKSQTSEAKPPAETPKPEQPPAQAEQPKAEQPKAEQPPAADPPKPKTAYDAPYDTARIAADARAYGEGIGMTWSGSLTTGNCSWEAPIQTSSVLSGERLESAVQSGIRRVKKLQQDNEYQPGEFHFRLYLEPSGDGEYSLYFLMG